MERKALASSIGLHAGVLVLWLALPLERTTKKYRFTEAGSVTPLVAVRLPAPVQFPLPQREASGQRPNEAGARKKTPEPAPEKWTTEVNPFSRKEPASGEQGPVSGIPEGGGAGGPGGGALVSHLAFEAEDAQLMLPMRVMKQWAASKGEMINSPRESAGAATFVFEITVPGTYVVWCRVLSPQAKGDSFYVSVDGMGEDIYDTSEGSWSGVWQWTRVNARAGGWPLTVNPRLFVLSAGRHWLTFRAREPYTCLDQVIITRDLNFVPQ